jgi:hypothetical protein
MFTYKQLDCNEIKLNKERIKFEQTEYNKRFPHGFTIRRTFEENGILFFIYGGFRKKTYRGYLEVCSNHNYLFLQYINLDSTTIENGNFEKLLESIEIRK